MTAFNAPGQKVHDLRIGVHQVQQLHRLFRILGVLRDGPLDGLHGRGVGGSGDDGGGRNFLADRQGFLESVAGLERGQVCEGGARLEVGAVRFSGGDDVLGDVALEVPVAHALGHFHVGVAGVEVHHFGAVTEENAQAVAEQVDVGDEVFRSRGGFGADERHDARLVFLDHGKRRFKVVKRLDGGNVDAVALGHFLVENEAVFLGEIAHGGHGVLAAIDIAGLEEFLADHIDDALAVFLHQVGDVHQMALRVHAQKPLIVHAHQVDLFAAGEHEVHLLRVVGHVHVEALDADADLRFGYIAQLFEHEVEVRRFLGAPESHHQLDRLFSRGQRRRRNCRQQGERQKQGQKFLGFLHEAYLLRF